MRVVANASRKEGGSTKIHPDSATEHESQAICFKWPSKQSAKSLHFSEPTRSRNFTGEDDFDRLTSMRPRTYIFAVAVEGYQATPIQPVVYAEQDSQGFVGAWEKLGVDPADCVTLLSDQATHAGIRSRLRDLLAKVGSEDRFVLFYAGHGASIGGVSVLTAFDTQIEAAQKSVVPLIELLNLIREVKCESVQLFLDASHNSVSSPSGLENQLGLETQLENHFPCDELKDFCKESASRFCVCFLQAK